MKRKMKNLSEMTADELHNQIAEFSAAVEDCVRAADEVKKAADNYKKLSDKYCDEMEKFLTELEKDVAAFKKKDRALTEEMFGNVKIEAKKHFEEESPKIYEDVVKIMLNTFKNVQHNKKIYQIKFFCNKNPIYNTLKRGSCQRQHRQFRKAREKILYRW